MCRTSSRAWIWARKTYNARSEEVARKRTYKEAWANSHRCIIPAECVFEPCYETGEAVRWQIQQPMQVPMGIAGIYKIYQHPVDGHKVLAMSMLTVNADGHPVMSRFHAPGDEKRMVVILDPKDYTEWLTCSPEQAVSYCRQWTEPLEAFPSPLARRPRKERAAPSVPVDDLFGIPEDLPAPPKSRSRKPPGQLTPKAPEPPASPTGDLFDPDPFA